MTPHREKPRRGVITAEKIDLDFHDILKHSDSRKARMAIQGATRIYTDLKEKTSRLVCPHDIMAGSEEEQMNAVEKSKIITEYIASNGGVSGRGLPVGGGNQKSKTVYSTLYVTGCGKVFATNESRARENMVRLHKKVCPICSKRCDPNIRTVKMTHVEANSLGTHQLAIDVSNSYYMEHGKK